MGSTSNNLPRPSKLLPRPRYSLPKPRLDVPKPTDVVVTKDYTKLWKPETEIKDPFTDPKRFKSLSDVLFNREAEADYLDRHREGILAGITRWLQSSQEKSTGLNIPMAGYLPVIGPLAMTASAAGKFIDYVDKQYIRPDNKILENPAMRGLAVVNSIGRDLDFFTGTTLVKAAFNKGNLVDALGRGTNGMKFYDYDFKTGHWLGNTAANLTAEVLSDPTLYSPLFAKALATKAIRGVVSELSEEGAKALSKSLVRAVRSGSDVGDMTKMATGVLQRYGVKNADELAGRALKDLTTSKTYSVMKGMQAWDTAATKIAFGGSPIGPAIPLVKYGLPRAAGAVSNSPLLRKFTSLEDYKKALKHIVPENIEAMAETLSKATQRKFRSLEVRFEKFFEKAGVPDLKTFGNEYMKLYKEVAESTDLTEYVKQFNAQQLAKGLELDDAAAQAYAKSRLDDKVLTMYLERLEVNPDFKKFLYDEAITKAENKELARNTYHSAGKEYDLVDVVNKKTEHLRENMDKLYEKNKGVIKDYVDKNLGDYLRVRQMESDEVQKHAMKNFSTIINEHLNKVMSIKNIESLDMVEVVELLQKDFFQGVPLYDYKNYFKSRLTDTQLSQELIDSFEKTMRNYFNMNNVPVELKTLYDVVDISRRYKKFDVLSEIHDMSEIKFIELNNYIKNNYQVRKADFQTLLWKARKGSAFDVWLLSNNLDGMSESFIDHISTVFKDAKPYYTPEEISGLYNKVNSLIKNNIGIRLSLVEDLKTLKRMKKEYLNSFVDPQKTITKDVLKDDLFKRINAPLKSETYEDLPFIKSKKAVHEKTRRATLNNAILDDILVTARGDEDYLKILNYIIEDFNKKDIFDEGLFTNHERITQLYKQYVEGNSFRDDVNRSGWALTNEAWDNIRAVQPDPYSITEYSVFKEALEQSVKDNPSTFVERMLKKLNILEELEQEIDTLRQARETAKGVTNKVTADIKFKTALKEQDKIVDFFKHPRSLKVFERRIGVLPQAYKTIETAGDTTYPLFKTVVKDLYAGSQQYKAMTTAFENTIEIGRNKIKNFWQLPYNLDHALTRLTEPEQGVYMMMFSQRHVSASVTDLIRSTPASKQFFEDIADPKSKTSLMMNMLAEQIPDAAVKSEVVNILATTRSANNYMWLEEELTTIAKTAITKEALASNPKLVKEVDTLQNIVANSLLDALHSYKDVKVETFLSDPEWMSRVKHLVKSNMRQAWEVKLLSESSNNLITSIYTQLDGVLETYIKQQKKIHFNNSLLNMPNGATIDMLDRFAVAVDQNVKSIQGVRPEEIYDMLNALGGYKFAGEWSYAVKPIEGVLDVTDALDTETIATYRDFGILGRDDTFIGQFDKLLADVKRFNHIEAPKAENLIPASLYTNKFKALGVDADSGANIIAESLRADYTNVKGQQRPTGRKKLFRGGEVKFKTENYADVMGAAQVLYANEAYRKASMYVKDMDLVAEYGHSMPMKIAQLKATGRDHIMASFIIGRDWTGAPIPFIHRLVDDAVDKMSFEEILSFDEFFKNYKPTRKNYFTIRESVKFDPDSTKKALKSVFKEMESIELVEISRQTGVPVINFSQTDILDQLKTLSSEQIRLLDDYMKQYSPDYAALKNSMGLDEVVVRSNIARMIAENKHNNGTINRLKMIYGYFGKEPRLLDEVMKDSAARNLYELLGTENDEILEQFADYLGITEKKKVAQLTENFLNSRHTSYQEYFLAEYLKTVSKEDILYLDFYIKNDEVLNSMYENLILSVDDLALEATHMVEKHVVSNLNKLQPQTFTDPNFTKFAKKFGHAPFTNWIDEGLEDLSVNFTSKLNSLDELTSKAYPVTKHIQSGMNSLGVVKEMSDSLKHLDREVLSDATKILYMRKTQALLNMTNEQFAYAVRAWGRGWIAIDNADGVFNMKPLLRRADALADMGIGLKEVDGKYFFYNTDKTIDYSQLVQKTYQFDELPTNKFMGKEVYELPDRYVVIDVETSNKDGQILQFAATRVDNGVVVDKKQIWMMPDSREGISDEAFKVHGITLDMLKNNNAISQTDGIKQIREYIGSDTLVAHNGYFDVNAIYKTSVAADGVHIDNPFVDSLAYAEGIHKYVHGKLKDYVPGRTHFRLQDLAEELGIQFSKSKLHDAMYDVDVLQEILARYRHSQNSLGLRAKGELLNTIKKGSRYKDQAYDLFYDAPEAFADIKKVLKEYNERMQKYLPEKVTMFAHDIATPTQLTKEMQSKFFQRLFNNDVPDLPDAHFAADIFDESILKTNNNIFGSLNRIMDYNDKANSNLINQLSAGYIPFMQMNNAKAKYWDLFDTQDFQLQNSLYSNVFSNMKSAELRDWFRKNKFTVVVPYSKGDTLKVTKYYINSVKDYQKAMKLNAIIVPDEVYSVMYRTINDHKFNGVLAQFYVRILMATYKSAFLTSVGFPARNELDIIYKNMAATGDSFLTVANNIKLAKDMLVFHNKVHQTAVDKFGKVTRPAVLEILKGMSPELQNTYFFVDAFTNSTASSGLSKTLRTQLKEYIDVPLDTKFEKFAHTYDEVLMDNPISRAVQSATEFVESTGRLGLIISDFEKSGSLSKAFNLAVEAHFDYNTKRSVELLAELFIPFVTFPIRNVAFHMNKLTEHPEALKLYMDAWEESYGDDEQFGLAETPYNRGLAYHAAAGNLRIGDTVLKTNPSLFDAISLILNPKATLLERTNPLIKAVNSLRTKDYQYTKQGYKGKAEAMYGRRYGSDEWEKFNNEPQQIVNKDWWKQVIPGYNVYQRLVGDNGKEGSLLRLLKDPSLANLVNADGSLLGKLRRPYEEFKFDYGNRSYRRRAPRRTWNYKNKKYRGSYKSSKAIFNSVYGKLYTKRTGYSKIKLAVLTGKSGYYADPSKIVYAVNKIKWMFR